MSIEPSNIFYILNTISSESSTNQKLKLLKQFDSELLQRVLRLAYDSSVRYYIKMIPKYTSITIPSIDLMSALDVIENRLATRKETGNDAIQTVQSLLSSLPSCDAVVLSRVIERDLKIGLNVQSIDKVFPDMIVKTKVMLASDDISQIVYPAIAQPKLDGLRAHIIRIGDSIRIITRNGKLIEDLGVLTDSCLALMSPGETWDGEIVCINKSDPNKFLDRKTSNGILNKAIRGTINQHEANLIRFNTWDIVDTITPYSMRLWKLRERFDSVLDAASLKIYPVLGKIVQNHDEAQAYYEDEIAKGNEGIVLKNMKSLWVPKRSKDWCKLKEIKDCDLKVVGWQLGTGKNSNRLGNLVLETEDGRLRVSVGIGFSDDQREMLTEEYCIGKIAAIQYNAVIQPKHSCMYSLFLPRFVEIRDDKDTASSLDDIKCT